MPRSPRRSPLLIVFLALVWLGVYAVEQAEVAAQLVEDRGEHAPSLVPDRIILTWSGDPATTQSVSWRTDTTVHAALAEIAVSTDGPEFQENALQMEAVTELVATDIGEAHQHSAHFTGLTPKTMYAYRVGDGVQWSEWSQFTTASDGRDPLSFIYVGDAQNYIFSLWSRVIRMGYSKAPGAQFIVHAGDLVNTANRDADWGEWFRAAGWINQSVSSVPSPGNHEYQRNEDGGRQLSGHWRPQYALPMNGPAGLEETCYFLDIQGVRIISLNSNQGREEQALWLDEVLVDNPNRWTILTFHHPIFSAAKARDNAELRAIWLPVFTKHKIDLVLQGHDHSYARSNLMSGTNLQSDGDGTVYVVSVSGPKMYEVTADWASRRAEDTQLYQIIHIDGDKLSYESHTARGLLYDAFELHKRDGQANELVNRIPDMPERRRTSSTTAAAGRLPQLFPAKGGLSN